MFEIKVHQVAALIVMLSAVGCSHTAERAKLKEPAIEGRAVSQVEQISNGYLTDRCDEDFHELRMEIATELDRRARDLEMFATSQLKNEDPAGSASVASPHPRTEESVRSKSRSSSLLVDFRPLPIPKSKTSEKKEMEKSFGWARTRTDYEKIKNTPTDKKWLDLNLSVHSLLDEDLTRTHYRKSNFNTGSFLPTPEERPALLSIKRKVDRCLSRPGCATIKLTRNQLELIETYRPLQRAYRAASSHLIDIDERRHHLYELLFALDASDKAPDSLPANKSVQLYMVDGVTVLRLKLYPGALEPLKEKVAEEVSRIWSTEKYRLEIEWTSAPDKDNDVYAFNFDPLLGGRERVELESKSVVLFKGVHVSVIAHEIGHVLGLLDRYYTTWDAGSCSYIVHYDPSDLMSSGRTGVKALPRHWAQLMRIYGGERKK